MSDDISKLKVGQRPSGTEIQKSISPAVPAASLPRPPIAPVTPTPAPRASLGETEKARPLAPSTAPFSRPVQPQPSSRPPIVTMPSRSVVPSSRSVFYMVITVVVLLGAVVYWFLSGDDEEVAFSPTPSLVATSTPTPTPPVTINSLIGGTDGSLTLPSTGNVTAAFLNGINALALNPGELRKIFITNETKGSDDFSMTDLMDRLSIAYPAELKAALGTDSVILVYGQREAFNAQGQLDVTVTGQRRVAFLTEVRDPVAMAAILSSWENTMTDSLATIFSLNKLRAASTTFLTNARNDTSVRYRNFPFADKSIDYAVVQARNGRLYLLIAGSRETAYTIIDQLK